MKRILFALAAISALLFTLAAPAAAESHTPTVTISPITEYGEQEITVTGTDFVDTPGFFIPCPGVDPAVITTADFNAQADCDLGTGLAMGSYAPSGGEWEITLTYDIPDGGLTWVAGDASGDNTAGGFLTVGDATEETTAEETAEEPAEEALAETGVESTVLLIIGGAIMIAGAMVMNTRREVQA